MGDAPLAARIDEADPDRRTAMPSPRTNDTVPTPVDTPTTIPTTTMKAIVYDEFGGPEVLDLREVERPALEDDRVLVKVHAAAINPYDWHMIRGLPYIARASVGLRSPKSPIPGADFAGVIEAVGADVTAFAKGDEVFGSGPGTFAEYVTAREQSVVVKPEHVSFEQGASVVMAGMTALQGLRDRGNLQPGENVLINGASGGVGTFAVQIAKAMGAQVTAVCSSRNAATVRSVGADHVVDYTQEDFTRSGNRYDVIFDVVSTQSMSGVRRSLTDDGRYVNAGAVKMGNWIGPFTHLARVKLGSSMGKPTMMSMLAKGSQTDLVVLRDYLDSGEIVPVIDAKYPLAEVPEAMAHLETMHARGKVVITIS
ncbi:MAG: NAD(P)-dependent alcohol dehydrogenase [Actinomycetota bacterium]|nr:NAD(P)-dependent alcohol dehydrogenase [Actinomycetota bacterium]